ncbi:5-formyltetrahydrofolate cyclo-ligase, partial [uncultured Parolsenella sp.]|uniref:5-formyltetrahydrofolate cyclo-ligase n=1 Tax=uncultured Parolsenella sp. TaxID=2083008 RepID=UPI0025D67EF0
GPRRLAWYEVGVGETFERSRMGIDEPHERPERLVDVGALDADALALVPGLAFDARGYRLGYGGGFYDAFLRDFAGMSVGLCRSAMLLESLAALGATEPHDLPVGLVVTEMGTRGQKTRPRVPASEGAGISPA